MKQGVLHMYLF